MKVVIIGAGVAGLAIGWRLAQAKADVTILERSQPGSGQGLRQPGGMRRQPAFDSGHQGRQQDIGGGKAHPHFYSGWVFGPHHSNPM